MKNLGQLMKQAQDMQARMSEMQARLESAEIEGQSGAGMVQAVLSGKGDLRRLKIDPSLLVPDEAEILEGTSDVQATYDLLIRPWKCRLGLLYIERRTLGADIALTGLTVVAIIARPLALSLLDRILLRWGADTSTRELCLRQEPLRRFVIELKPS